MNEKAGKGELEAELERGHYARAALMAESLGMPEQKIQEIRIEALWQMSAVYRNASGTKRLAQQYGFSKKEVRESLEKHAGKKRDEGDKKPLEPCYDCSTGKYLAFEEWMDLFLKNWDKLSVS